MFDYDKAKQETRDLVERLDISFSELESVLKNIAVADAKKKMRAQVELSADLVGRCFVRKTNTQNSMFPVMNKYYKVISNRSTNEYRVECLVFDEIPTYWFDYHSRQMNRAENYYLGCFRFSSFDTVSVMARDIRRMKEISVEEYNDAARQYLEKLLVMDFPADHYRFGGKLPCDDGWKRDEKDK